MLTIHPSSANLIYELCSCIGIFRTYHTSHTSHITNHFLVVPKDLNWSYWWLWLCECDRCAMLVWDCIFILAQEIEILRCSWHKLQCNGCIYGSIQRYVFDLIQKAAYIRNIKKDYILDADANLVFYILMTLLPSAIPARLCAYSLPSVPRFSNSASHHPNKKSRAINLNHGVNEFANIGRSRG